MVGKRGALRSRFGFVAWSVSVAACVALACGNDAYVLPAPDSTSPDGMSPAGMSPAGMSPPGSQPLPSPPISSPPGEATPPAISPEPVRGLGCSVCRAQPPCADARCIPVYADTDELSALFTPSDVAVLPDGAFAVVGFLDGGPIDLDPGLGEALASPVAWRHRHRPLRRERSLRMEPSPATR